VSIAELLYSSRNADDLARLRLDLSSLPYLRMTSAAEQHLVDVMAALRKRAWGPSLIPAIGWLREHAGQG
jgi:predicted nucleic acid-binding protein